MKRPRQSATEWRRRVQAWRRSGESASEFAERRGWNPRTLTWWGSNIRGRGEERSRAASGSSFVEVVERREIAAEGGTPIELVLPRVGTVRVSAGTDLALLRAVVVALGGGE